MLYFGEFVRVGRAVMIWDLRGLGGGGPLCEVISGEIVRT